jgi:malonate transporter
METIATVSLPIFALLFSGYGAKRLGLLNAASIVGLNGFVYYFALPALFVVKVSETAVVRRFDWRLVAAYHGAGLCVFAVAMLCGWFLFGHRLAVLGLQGLGVDWGNVGYMGPPLVLAAFGDGATLPAAMILAFDIILPLSLAIALVEGDLGGRTRWREVGQTVAGGLARNPLMLAIVAGAFLSILGLTLPIPVRAFGTLLGGAALPCALFALGASLVGQPVTAGKTEVALLVALKLLAHPFVVWIMATEVFSLQPLWAKVAVIEAALPTAANLFVLAQRYNLYVDRASAIVFTSTLISVFTVSVLLALVVGE